MQRMVTAVKEWLEHLACQDLDNFTLALFFTWSMFLTAVVL